MQKVILGVMAAAALVTAAPSAMAQPYGYYHHRHFFGPRFHGPGYGYGFHHRHFGGGRFCYYHPYRC